MSDHHSHGEHAAAAPSAPIKNPFVERLVGLTSIFDGPATLFRNIVQKTRKEQPYYHREFKRVPTIDECDYNDVICISEANEQFLRDR
jgi:NADH dehydrogenase (ubiquinone) 1 beta subcomplex subunit 10